MITTQVEWGDEAQIKIEEAAIVRFYGHKRALIGKGRGLTEDVKEDEDLHFANNTWVVIAAWPTQS